MELQDIKEESKISLQQYTTSVFLKMSLGLLVTFITMVGFANLLQANPRVLYSIANNYNLVMLVTMLVQIGLVVTLSSKLFTLSRGASTGLFLVYAVTVGISFSVLAMFFLKPVILAFIACVLLFGSAAVIGFTTKKDVMRWQSFLTIGLVFLLIANIILMFTQAQALDHIISSVGIILFIALTIFDTQKMKKLYYSYEGDSVMLEKLSIYSAFQLYLDFINLFLYIFRILLGKRK